jgi:bifunctional aspartokinase / homoserine dehydrogenase 1
MKPNLEVMKFGGTSMGNADCIGRAARIVAEAAANREVVVVVSAMSGVTNLLIAAAESAARGDQDAATELADRLRRQHLAVIETLISDPERQTDLIAAVEQIVEAVSGLCRGTWLLRELTPRGLDSISSAGERLSCRLLAGVLRELGGKGVAVEGTELIVTDGVHGQSTPLPQETRARATAKLRPLLELGAVPVVSGFVGASVDGTLTTLGRGGSDYSATILGAALDAAAITIWTDVDGVLTADPRLVPGARTLGEISYAEAAELAYFGARVLHPKTLRPVVQSNIPVWIRNSFVPDSAGTKITASGHPTARGAKAITAISSVTLITVGGRGIVGVPGIAAKTFTAAAQANANVLLISQSSSGNDICFIVDSTDALATVARLREIFAYDLQHEEVEHINVNAEIAIVAVVGEMMRGTPGIAGRTFKCLGEQGINIIAIAQGSSEYNVSFVVAAAEMSAAVQAVHQEFDLQHGAARVEPAENDLATT